MSGTAGLTKDAGWQIGVTRVVPFPADLVWQVLIEQPDLWLGAGASLPRGRGEQWVNDAGDRGEMRSFRDDHRLRMTVQPNGRPEPTVLQLSVTETRTGASIRMHQERLENAEEREMQRQHWQRVIDKIVDTLDREL